MKQARPKEEEMPIAITADNQNEMSTTAMKCRIENELHIRSFSNSFIESEK